tara:strand:+ start:4962 stop:5531 length:570 start_codon:yes stop_codon:yes gene_type:complete
MLKAFSMKFFFIFILIILTSISFKSYINSKEDINKYLKNELHDLELNKEEKNIYDLVFKNHKGQEVKFSDFKDKILLVNFWATWCTPCIKEMPSLDRLKSKFDKNFDVIAISIDRDGLEKVTDFFKENNIVNLNKFFDIKNSLAKEMDLFGIPTSFFINKKGEIIGKYQGDMEWDNETVVKFIEYLIKI